MKISLFIITLTILFTAEFSLAQDSALDSKNYTNSATLQGLNKITTRISSLSISADKHATFGNLEISLLKCWHSPPEEEPENKALIKVWEQIPGEDKKEIFYGWMFTSSPALSALEHPVYDLTLISCNAAGA